MCHNHSHTKLPWKQATLNNNAFRNVASCICLCSINFCNYIFFSILIFWKGTLIANIWTTCIKQERRKSVILWDFQVLCAGTSLHGAMFQSNRLAIRQDLVYSELSPELCSTASANTIFIANLSCLEGFIYFPCTRGSVCWYHN